MASVLPVEHFVHALGGVRQHGLERDAGREAAVRRQRAHAEPQQHRHQQLVVGALAVRRLDGERVLLHARLRRATHAFY